VEGLGEVTIQLCRQFPHVRVTTIQRLVEAAADAHDQGEPTWSVLADNRQGVGDYLLRADPEGARACPRCSGGKTAGGRP
jgi:hypothetical protein